MDFGVGYFPTHDAMAPGTIARLVEERGQSALFFAEHTHIPASRDTPYGDGSRELSIFPRIAELRARADRPIDVQVISAPANPAVLQRLQEAGVRRASRWLPPAGRGTVERALERWEAAIAEFTGEQR